jgi:hypothetical protein
MEEEKLETIDITISTSSEPEFALDSFMLIEVLPLEILVMGIDPWCSLHVMLSDFYLSITRSPPGCTDILSGHLVLMSKISRVEVD